MKANSSLRSELSAASDGRAASMMNLLDAQILPVL